MRQRDIKYLVLGAGFAGLSTAYFLLKKGETDVCIVEKGALPGVGSSGRNASMVCQLVRDPIACEFMLEGTRLLKDFWLREFPEVSFEPCGSFHIGKTEQIDAFSESLEMAINRGVQVERLSNDETLNRFPYLCNSSFDEAIFCADDGLLDIHTLIDSLYKACLQMGATFIPNFNGSIKRLDHDTFLIDHLEESFTAETVVNAGGSWVDEIADSLGVQQLDVKPMRRHVFITEQAPFHEDVTNWPIIWDVTNEIYFRPMGDALVISPCDEDLVKPGCDEVGDHIENLLEEKLNQFFPRLHGTQYSYFWAGLRTFSKDRRFVIGPDAQCENFFWVSCLGGYGMTSSAKVGEFAASLLRGEAVNPLLKEAVDPKRFQEEWVK